MVRAQMTVTPILEVILRTLVIMGFLLQLIGIIIHPMTQHDFFKPLPAQSTATVSQVIGIVFPGMGWLAKVMFRSVKVTGSFAGCFSGTCSASVPAFRVYHGLLRGSSANQQIVYVNTGALGMSVTPRKQVA